MTKNRRVALGGLLAAAMLAPAVASARPAGQDAGQPHGGEDRGQPRAGEDRGQPRGGEDRGRQDGQDQGRGRGQGDRQGQAQRQPATPAPAAAAQQARPPAQAQVQVQAQVQAGRGPNGGQRYDRGQGYAGRPGDGSYGRGYQGQPNTPQQRPAGDPARGGYQGNGYAGGDPRGQRYGQPGVTPQGQAQVYRGGQYGGQDYRGQNYRGQDNRNQGYPGQGYRGQGYAGERGGQGNWNRGWRQDQRFDYGSYRRQNYRLFGLPRYAAPRGWSYGYRRFSVGVSLSAVLFDRSYWIADPYAYRLPPAYGDLRWVRYYNDALLVDLDSGQVVDTVYGIFY